MELTIQRSITIERYGRQQKRNKDFAYNVIKFLPTFLFFTFSRFYMLLFVAFVYAFFSKIYTLVYTMVLWLFVDHGALACSVHTSLLRLTRDTELSV